MHSCQRGGSRVWEKSKFCPTCSGKTDRASFYCAFVIISSTIRGRATNFELLRSWECREYEKNQNSALHLIAKELDQVFITLMLLSRVLFVEEQRILHCCPPESAGSMRIMKFLFSLQKKMIYSNFLCLLFISRVLFVQER